MGLETTYKYFGDAQFWSETQKGYSLSTPPPCGPELAREGGETKKSKQDMG